MKYVELERTVRVTPNKVSKFKDPCVHLWHLASPPEYGVSLQKDSRYWVRRYAGHYTNNLESAVRLCHDILTVLGIPIEKFHVSGSSTLTTEWLREQLQSLSEKAKKEGEE